MPGDTLELSLLTGSGEVFWDNGSHARIRRVYGVEWIRPDRCIYRTSIIIYASDTLRRQVELVRPTCDQQCGRIRIDPVNFADATEFCLSGVPISAAAILDRPLADRNPWIRVNHAGTDLPVVDALFDPADNI